MAVLVAYFSAQGHTKKIAAEAAKLISADLFEIKPVHPYTAGDIKWINPFARCNREKLGKKDVPVEGKISAFDSYDTILIGFPIWYGSAPNVINTFCKGYHWQGKKVALFATSGGSGMGKTAQKLAPYIPGATIISDKLIRDQNDLETWINSLK